MKRVALFGGGGFVGVNLARRLAETTEFLPVVYDTTDEKLVLRFRDTVPCAFNRLLKKASLDAVSRT